MASSLYKAQVNTFCNFCENQNAVQWKCLNCTDLMCTACKKSHEKFSATKSHRIVSLKDLNEDLLKDEDSPKACAAHNETCKVFCVDCDISICSTCMVKLHKDHTFEELADFRRDTKERIRSTLAKIQFKKESYAKYEASSDEQRIENELNDRKHKLIASIEKKYRLLKKELTEFYQEANKQVERVHKTDKLLELTTKQSTLEEIMRTTDVSEHVTRIREIERDVEILLSNIPDLKYVHFQTGDITDDDMAGEFGYLNFKTKSTLKIDLHSMETIEVVKTFSTEIKSITSICPNSNNTTWIHSIGSKMISLLDNKKLTGKPIHQVAITSNNCCVSGDQLFVCDDTNQSIKSISQNGSMTTVKDMKPLKPRCLHVTLSNDMIVGAVDKISDKVDQHSRRVVFKMTMSGTVKQELEYDTRDIRLFTQPNRCTVNEQNNDLLVIDRLSSYTGRVICFLENGDVKFRYFGDLSLKLPTSFDPSGCLFANNGLIIINDYGNSSLHILNPEGNLVTYMSLEDIGIVNPLSIAFDNCERLWIGTYPGEGNAQVYITHFK